MTHKGGTMMALIKVLIVEDDPTWVKLLEMQFAIEKDIEIVATVNDKIHLYEILNTKDIDVILMDINLSSNHLDGVYIAAEVSEESEVKIIMLTSLDPKEVALDSFNAGAIAFVSKEDYRQLPQIIRNAIKPNLPMEELLEDYRRLKEQEVLKELSSAEREVVYLLAKGHTRASIGKKLVKSDSTVKNQINKILKKLKVESTKEAIKKVELRGLYRPDYKGLGANNEQVHK